jgi:hypothetical protein
MPKWDKDVIPERVEDIKRGRVRVLIPPGQSIQSLATANPGGDAARLKGILNALSNRTAKAVADGDSEDNWIDLDVSFRGVFHTTDPDSGGNR